ncbi:hypothetical protein BDF19DRAFT_419248 [Syncephalis fuscata]|nr:hypothetical protein BDF19DRAFT_419248 [Syncephalis fuscata]
MVKAIKQRAQLVHWFGIGGIVIYIIGCALVFGGWIFHINFTTLSSDKTAIILIRFGYGLTFSFSFFSAGLLVLGVGVCARKALTRFDEEPDLTNRIPDVIPNAAVAIYTDRVTRWRHTLPVYSI